jgi:hypothetical protein
VSKWYWKRINYLTHRWIGVALGMLMFVWFLSGIVMMYYPFPVLTESERDSLLVAFNPPEDLVGFEAAYEAAVSDFHERGHHAVSEPESNVVGGRLSLWNDRLVYRLWNQRGYRIKPYLVVDARSGEVLSPISPEQATRAARVAVGPVPVVEGVELLPRGDHYMFYGVYHLEEFPIYRVRFDDRNATAVYLGRETGAVYATANRVTRITTWLGTVPHWLYFMWLYERMALWTWMNLILPGVAAVIALTGMVLGTYQLFPRRRRGEWRVSSYRGMSKWHHLSGVVFGFLVFTWTLSGVFEMLGESNDPRSGQAEAVREGSVKWDEIRIGERAALSLLRDSIGGPLFPVAIDLVQFLGEPGYHVILDDRREFWVDAQHGSIRGELSPEAVRLAGERVAGEGVSIVSVDRVTEYDDYYYHRHGREVHLPVWRIGFDDPERSALYLDTVTGMPTGFVAADTRLWRWLRDGMHSLDFAALVNHRPLWDLVVSPLMIGGLISAATGVWLLARRLRRIATR